MATQFVRIDCIRITPDFGRKQNTNICSSSVTKFNIIQHGENNHVSLKNSRCCQQAFR